MVTVEKITGSMLPKVYEFMRSDPVLQGELWEPWKNLFNAELHEENDCFGYALVDSARVVGILGALFSTRSVNGERKRFCNLHTWLVEQEYRGHSLRLMRQVLGLTDCTFLDFTPTKRVRDICKRLGFQELDCTLKILLPIPLAGRRRTNATPQFISEVQRITAGLNAVDRKVCIDHHAEPCKHLLVQHQGESCYIVYTTVERSLIPYCYIHYVSNTRLFVTLSGSIRTALTRNSTARFVAVDARAVSGFRLPFSVNCPIQAHQIYRSQDVIPQEIDSLYSEICWLNLSTFPQVVNHVRSAVERLWDASWRWTELRGALHREIKEV